MARLKFRSRSRRTQAAPLRPGSGRLRGADLTIIPGGGMLLFAETFADANFAGRGWYDFGAADRVASPAPPGLPGSLRFTWTTGQSVPSTGTMRKLFTATDRLYLRYQTAFSANWAGSGQSFHPHVIEVLSDLDGAFDGPSDSRLAVYSEVHYSAGNRPKVAFQDNQYVDPTHIGSVGADEARATCGANGQRGDADVWNLFQSNDYSHGWYNQREFVGANQMAAGDTAWHTVVLEVVLNSIVGGVTQLDGVCRLWWDGKLVWNHTNLEMRTNTRPTLKLNQFLFVPYMESGSPVTQTMYIADLEARTGAGSVANIAVSRQPGGATDNAVFTTQPTVQLRDSSNRPVPQAGVSITASIISGLGSLIGTATAVTNSGGEAAWTNLGINASTPPSSFTLRFTSGSMTVDSGSFTVAAAGGGGGNWPNEPAGFTLVTDYAFSDPLPSGAGQPVGSGWSINNGTAVRVSDATAPVSPNFVASFVYPVNFQSGSAPATMWYNVGSANELYIGLYWKPSNPWDFEDPSDVNKICFQFDANGVDAGILKMQGNRTIGVTSEYGAASNRPANVGSPLQVTLGQWHLLEWYLKRSTNQMKWWVNGVLQGDYSNIPYPGGGSFGEFQLSPTWGGNNPSERKTQEDYYRYDHIRISKHA